MRRTRRLSGRLRGQVDFCGNAGNASSEGGAGSLPQADTGQVCGARGGRGWAGTRGNVGRFVGRRLKIAGLGAKGRGTERRCGTEEAAKGRGAGPETAGRGVRFSRTVDVLAVGAGRSVRLKLAGRRVGGFLCCEGQARSTPEAEEAAGAETGGSAGIPGGRRGASGSIRREGLRNGRRRGREQKRRGLPKKIGRQRLFSVFGEMREKGGRGKRCVCGTEAAAKGRGTDGRGAPGARRGKGEAGPAPRSRKFLRGGESVPGQIGAGIFARRFWNCGMRTVGSWILGI